MGPMIAAGRFATLLGPDLSRIERIEVKLYGSLALTGRGHATDTAVLLGLSGFEPATLDPDAARGALSRIRTAKAIKLAGSQEMPFDEDRDVVWCGRERLPQHPNALSFRASFQDGETHERTYFSIGGGFVRDEIEMTANKLAPGLIDAMVPHPFENAADLLDRCAREELTIAELMRVNERTRRSDAEIDAGLDRIAMEMSDCIDRGIRGGGELPGGLRVKRRAGQMFTTIMAQAERQVVDPLAALDWVNLWALAVNEENAAGGRVVTAPTNGAAGIIPAVLRYYDRFHNGSITGRRTFLLTAAAIGALYKRNASISGADVGCQGEVGVACSMAAAGLAAALDGAPLQVDNAAEIGMEHNLGLTCDPVGGLVQIPCIERNAMGAIKAIDAARLALLGDGQHLVSLDKVIATMLRTGRDMNEIYKETSLGGLAVSLPEC